MAAVLVLALFVLWNGASSLPLLTQTGSASCTSRTSAREELKKLEAQ
jgi:hypothetical protein